MTVFLAIIDDDSGYHYKAFDSYQKASNWLDLATVQWELRHPQHELALTGATWQQVATATKFDAWFGIEELTVY